MKKVVLFLILLMSVIGQGIKAQELSTATLIVLSDFDGTERFLIAEDSSSTWVMRAIEWDSLIAVISDSLGGFGIVAPTEHTNNYDIPKWTTGLFDWQDSVSTGMDIIDTTLYSLIVYTDSVYLYVENDTLKFRSSSSGDVTKAGDNDFTGVNTFAKTVSGSYDLTLYNNSSGATADSRFIIGEDLSAFSVGILSHQNVSNPASGMFKTDGTTLLGLGAGGLTLGANNASGDVGIYAGGNADANLVLHLNDDLNVGLGTTLFGTNAVKTFSMGIGTAPTTSPADVIQLYVKDRSGAGTSDLYVRNEEGNEYLLSQSAGGGDVTEAGNNDFTGVNNFADSVQAAYIHIEETDQTTGLYVHNSPSGIDGHYYGVRVRFDGTSTGVYTAYSVLGINSLSNLTGANIGVYGAADDGKTNTGVWGTCSGDSTNTGVKGSASGGTVNWSGYFDPADVFIGDVLHMGATTPPSSTANTAKMWAADSAAGYTEMYMIDEQGVITQQTEHAMDAPAWMYDYPNGGADRIGVSYDVYKGLVTFNNFDRDLKLNQMGRLNKTLPTDSLDLITFYQETYSEYNSRTGHNLQTSDWDADQETYRVQSLKDIRQWEDEKQTFDEMLAKGKNTMKKFIKEKPRLHKKKKQPKRTKQGG